VRSLASPDPRRLEPPPAPGRRAGRSAWLRFDRNELAGAFGDIGTDLPLLLAMIPAAGLDTASVFVLFGLAQILTGLAYGLPMPMQPLKAMAVIVITQRLSANVLFGGGLAIGVVMLILAVSGLLGWLARVIPHCVVRGVQLGLALSLGQLALQRYVPAMGVTGYVLAAVCFVVIAALDGNRRFPAALPVIVLGMLAAVGLGIDVSAIVAGVGVQLPRFRVPALGDIATGFIVLALPQLPLSLSNSVIATHKTLADLFPERSIGVRKIGLTYGIANLLLPFFGGVPVCHGCGGLAGHYAFGGRTGGSVVIYGTMYVVFGLFFSGVASEVVRLFPQPVLGVILLFEALALALLVRDITSSRQELAIGIVVALCAAGLPQGYVVGLVVGTGLYYTNRFALPRART
jgi:MFS superfamily sulfate permease-like transporter